MCDESVSLLFFGTVLKNLRFVPATGALRRFFYGRVLMAAPGTAMIRLVPAWAATCRSSRQPLRMNSTRLLSWLRAIAVVEPLVLAWTPDLPAEQETSLLAGAQLGAVVILTAEVRLGGEPAPVRLG